MHHKAYHKVKKNKCVGSGTTSYLQKSLLAQKKAGKGAFSFKDQKEKKVCRLLTLRSFLTGPPPQTTRHAGEYQLK
jgi:hypothetical protein